jgi:hypothetical protein
MRVRLQVAGKVSAYKVTIVTMEELQSRGSSKRPIYSIPFFTFAPLQLDLQNFGIEKLFIFY